MVIVAVFLLAESWDYNFNLEGEYSSIFLKPHQANDSIIEMQHFSDLF